MLYYLYSVLHLWGWGGIPPQDGPAVDATNNREHVRGDKLNHVYLIDAILRLESRKSEDDIDT